MKITRYITYFIIFVVITICFYLYDYHYYNSLVQTLSNHVEFWGVITNVNSEESDGRNNKVLTTISYEYNGKNDYISFSFNSFLSRYHLLYVPDYKTGYKLVIYENNEINFSIPEPFIKTKKIEILRNYISIVFFLMIISMIITRRINLEIDKKILGDRIEIYYQTKAFIIKKIKTIDLIYLKNELYQIVDFSKLESNNFLCYGIRNLSLKVELYKEKEKYLISKSDADEVIQEYIIIDSKEKYIEILINVFKGDYVFNRKT